MCCVCDKKNHMNVFVDETGRAILLLVRNDIEYRSQLLDLSTERVAEVRGCRDLVVTAVDDFTLRVFSNESVALNNGVLLRRVVRKS